MEKLSNIKIQRKQLQIIANNLKTGSSEFETEEKFFYHTRKDFSTTQRKVIKEIKNKISDEKLTKNMPSK